MERLANAQTGPRYAEDAATIRKHIEDQERQIEEAARMLIDNDDRAKAQQRRIGELEKALREIEAATFEGRGPIARRIRALLSASEPETG